MFRFRRDKPTEISRRRRSQDFSMTADIDAKLPERPSLEGYKVEVLSLDSVVHLFKRLRRVPWPIRAAASAKLEGERVRQAVRANIGLMHHGERSAKEESECEEDCGVTAKR